MLKILKNDEKVIFWIKGSNYVYITIHITIKSIQRQ